MAKINPQTIKGSWLAGIALDVHTISSTLRGNNEAGHPVFDTKRSELGELLYRLKYQGDKSAAADIITTVSNFLRPHRSKFDMLIPVPPSAKRMVQPVALLANGISDALGLPLVECTTTREATQLKDIADPEKRKELLAGLYAVDAAKTAGKNVLLFDDLFRSGATMNAITEVLLREGKAATVRVLTLTRTRSNQ